MSTATTDRLHATLRTRALTYVPKSGVTLSTLLNGQMHRQAPPANAAYPYAYFALKSPIIADGFQQLLMQYTFEGFIINRPRSTQPACEDIADQWCEAFRTYVDNSSGLFRFTDVVAESLPPFPAPADSNVVQIRITAKLHVFPQFISALTT